MSRTSVDHQTWQFQHCSICFKIQVGHVKCTVLSLTMYVIVTQFNIETFVFHYFQVVVVCLLLFCFALLLTLRYTDLYEKHKQRCVGLPQKQTSLEGIHDCVFLLFYMGLLVPYLWKKGTTSQ